MFSENNVCYNFLHSYSYSSVPHKFPNAPSILLPPVCGDESDKEDQWLEEWPFYLEDFVAVPTSLLKETGFGVPLTAVLIFPFFLQFSALCLSPALVY